MSDKRPLCEYFPPIMRNVREIKAICAGWQPDIHLCADELQRLRDNLTVLHSDEQGVVIREEIWQITPPPVATLLERKFAILAMQNERIPYTYRQLMRMLTSLLGAENFDLTINFDLYILRVLLVLTSSHNYATMQKMLRRVVPANMHIDPQLWYNQHKRFRCATHGQLRPFTHWELRHRTDLDFCNLHPIPELELNVTDISFPTGTWQKTIEITSNVAWEVTADANWFDIISHDTGTHEGYGNGNVEIVVHPNLLPTDRTATIFVTGGGITRTVAVWQEAVVILWVDVGTLNFPTGVFGANFAVESNTDWIVTSDVTWLHFYAHGSGDHTGTGEDVVDVVADPNLNTTQRTATITVTAGNKTETIGVVQEGRELQWGFRQYTRGAVLVDWTDICYTGARYVAVAKGHEQYTMTSYWGRLTGRGNNWNVSSTGFAQQRQWGTVGYGNGRCLCLSMDNSGYIGQLLDGSSTWSFESGVQFQGGAWSPIPYSWAKIRYGGGRFCAIAKSGHYLLGTSPTDMQVYMGLGAYDWEYLAYENGAFWALTKGSPGRFGHLPDGSTTWTTTNFSWINNGGFVNKDGYLGVFDAGNGGSVFAPATMAPVPNWTTRATGLANVSVAGAGSGIVAVLGTNTQAIVVENVTSGGWNPQPKTLPAARAHKCMAFDGTGAVILTPMVLQFLVLEKM